MKLALPLIVLTTAFFLLACHAGVPRSANPAASENFSRGSCDFDSDCGRLEHCLGQSCSKKMGACDFDSDCSFGEECRGASCSQKMSECTFGSDCDSGNCLAGSCI